MIEARKIMPHTILTNAIYAWNSTCRELKCTYLPLDPTILNQVLMLINLTLPDAFIK